MSSSGGAESLPLSHRRGTIIGVTVSFQILATFAVLFRLYARVKLVHSPGWDDLFIVIASVFQLLGSTTISLSTDYGLGQHIDDLTLDHILKYLKLFWIMNAAYVLSTAFIKLSILCQYLRVFEMPRVRKLCKILLVFTALWGAVFGFMVWFPCFPVHAFWDRSVPSAKCYAYGSQDPTVFVDTYLVQGAIDVFLDLVIYIIPIPVFMRQKLGRRERYGFLALFFLGLTVCVCSTYRLGTLVAHMHSTSDDWSWYSPITDIMSILEVNIAVIAASVPIFWPMLEAGLGVISITQEVHITRQYRRHNDSEMELERGSTRKSGSDTELHRKESATSYRDTYITFEPVDGAKIWSSPHGERPP